MSEKLSKSGQCLCKSVTLESDSVSSGVGACHCSMCRRWGGGPLMAVDAGTDVKFEGRENITEYDSSEWAKRGFCKKCGTHLYYFLKLNGQYIVPLGLFNDDEGFEFDHQIFIDHKSGLYDFSNSTKTMTEAEVFAMYAPAESGGEE